MRRKIIIDTDPGQDDGVAILLALASAELDVLGVVAVAGNVPLAQTAANARSVLELAERSEIPVFAGCGGPMHGALVTAERVHGRTGLENSFLKDATVPLQAQHGVDFIADTLRAAGSSDPITLCCLGPLTNLAVALGREPGIVDGIREIVLMGGAYFEGGNVTPAAEFNIHVDPEAADTVLRCGAAITMLPLDATHGVRSTPERLARIEALGNRCARSAAEMMGFARGFSAKKYGWDGAALHDPNVIAYLLDPSIYAGRTINVAVETGSPLTRGMTVADYWGVTDRPPNAHWIHSVRADAFYDLLAERLAVLP